MRISPVAAAAVGRADSLGTELSIAGSLTTQLPGFQPFLPQQRYYVARIAAGDLKESPICANYSHESHRVVTLKLRD